MKKKLIFIGLCLLIFSFTPTTALADQKGSRVVIEFKNDYSPESSNHSESTKTLLQSYPKTNDFMNDRWFLYGLVFVLLTIIIKRKNNRHEK